MSEVHYNRPLDRLNWYDASARTVPKTKPKEKINSLADNEAINRDGVHFHFYFYFSFSLHKLINEIYGFDISLKASSDPKTKKNKTKQISPSHRTVWGIRFTVNGKCFPVVVVVCIFIFGKFEFVRCSRCSDTKYMYSTLTRWQMIKTDTMQTKCHQSFLWMLLS